VSYLKSYVYYLVSPGACIQTESGNATAASLLQKQKLPTTKATKSNKLKGEKILHSIFCLDVCIDFSMKKFTTSMSTVTFQLPDIIWSRHLQPLHANRCCVQGEILSGYYFYNVAI
jgi:hypothetical protein